MTVGQALLGFAVVAGLLTIIPGIDTALVLRSAVGRSRGYAVATALGIQTGVVVWGMAAAVGATAVLAASATAYRVLSLVGAVYLVWMGCSMLARSFRRGVATEAEVPGPRGGALRGWGTGVMTNLLNPKVGVFYLAMIPQFLPAGVPPLIMGVALALVHCLLGLIWFLGLIGLGSALGSRLRTPRFTRWLDRVTGGVLLAFGTRLVFEQRG